MQEVYKIITSLFITDRNFEVFEQYTVQFENFIIDKFLASLTLFSFIKGCLYPKIVDLSIIPVSIALLDHVTDDRQTQRCDKFALL